MKLEDGKEIKIPKKLQNECINSWYNKKKIQPINTKFNKTFLINFGTLAIGIILIILFLYALSMMRYITSKFTF